MKQYRIRDMATQDAARFALVNPHDRILGPHTFFAMVLASHDRPVEVTTDLAPSLLRVVDELLPAAVHDTAQYANNRIENDHGRLKARLRPMRGLRADRTASAVIRGHAFMQNLRAATTNLVSKRSIGDYAWRQHSTNSPKQSDRTPPPNQSAAPVDRPTQHCPLWRSAVYVPVQAEA
jgi:hypothetical protein